MPRLKYLSEDILERLRDSVPENRDRYLSGTFDDLSHEAGWEIESNIEADLDLLEALNPAGTPESEISNSRLVWEALPGLSPALACEERIWARLCHVECLPFARKRWLEGLEPEKVDGSIEQHFFANGITKRRDDNALSRLWWNFHIANRLMPGNEQEALEAILRTADTRLNFVERPRTVARKPVGAAIIGALRNETWLSEAPGNFRKFMISLNRDGAGILFESIDQEAAETVVQKAISDAQLSAS